MSLPAKPITGFTHFIFVSGSENVPATLECQTAIFFHLYGSSAQCRVSRQNNKTSTSSSPQIWPVEACWLLQHCHHDNRNKHTVNAVWFGLEKDGGLCYSRSWSGTVSFRQTVNSWAWQVVKARFRKRISTVMRIQSQLLIKNGVPNSPDWRTFSGEWMCTVCFWLLVWSCLAHTQHSPCFISSAE